jgi:hypothetical protein
LYNQAQQEAANADIWFAGESQVCGKTGQKPQPQLQCQRWGETEAVLVGIQMVDFLCEVETLADPTFDVARVQPNLRDKTIKITGVGRIGLVHPVSSVWVWSQISRARYLQPLLEEGDVFAASAWTTAKDLNIAMQHFGYDCGSPTMIQIVVDRLLSESPNLSIIALLRSAPVQHCNAHISFHISAHRIIDVIDTCPKTALMPMQL